MAIEGPSEAKMTCKDNRDGSCTVEYIPTEAGDYDISIKFADQSIPGSPFKVHSSSKNSVIHFNSFINISSVSLMHVAVGCIIFYC